jgi:hypothetical protein
MWQDLGNLLFITAFFVALPIAVDMVVFWRLLHASTDYTRTPTRMVIGYVGLVANLSAIAIVYGSFYCNLWLSNHGSGMAVGSMRLYKFAFVLDLFSLIFGFITPKGVRPLSVFAGLYVGTTMLFAIAGDLTGDFCTR